MDQERCWNPCLSDQRFCLLFTCRSLGQGGGASISPLKKKKDFPLMLCPAPTKSALLPWKCTWGSLLFKSQRNLKCSMVLTYSFVEFTYQYIFIFLYACSNQKPLNKTIENRNTLHSFKKIFYLFLERGEGRERGRETSMCGCSSQSPDWGHGL